MRIVVTGGTGFIGREVVELLVGAGGHDVTVATREPGQPDLWGGRVRYVQAFAGDATSLGRAFARADVVVHAIQFPNHPVEKPSKGLTYLEVDGRGTVTAAKVAKAMGVRCPAVPTISGISPPASHGHAVRWLRLTCQEVAFMKLAGQAFLHLDRG